MSMISRQIYNKPSTRLLILPTAREKHHLPSNPNPNQVSQESRLRNDQDAGCIFILSVRCLEACKVGKHKCSQYRRIGVPQVLFMCIGNASSILRSMLLSFIQNYI